MSKETYQQKLKSPHWQRKRLEILQRDNFACTLCCDTETTLHIHHEKYSGEPWEIPNEHLKTVCEDCHDILHVIKDAKQDPKGVVKIFKLFGTPRNCAFAYSDFGVGIFIKENNVMSMTVMMSYDFIATINENKPLING